MCVVASHNSYVILLVSRQLVFCEFSPTPPPSFLFLETEGNFPGLMVWLVIARVLEGICPFFFFFSKRAYALFESSCFCGMCICL